MSDFFSSLGLRVDSGSPLRRLPSVVVYGPPGSGKSTEMALAFQDALFVKTSSTVTRPYASYLREMAPEAFAAARADYLARGGSPDDADHAGLAAAGAALGLRYPLAEVTLPGDVPNWPAISQLVSSVGQLKANGYSGIVFDEYTEIIDRVYREMIASGQFKSKSGRLDDFAAQDGLEEWMRATIDAMRDANALMGMVCQEDGAKFFEDPNKLHYGEMKAACGPMVPFARLRTTICAKPDIVLRITLKPPGGMALGAPKPAATTPKPLGAGATATPATPPAPAGYVERAYWTEASDKAFAKFRDFGIGHREGLGLRRLIQRAGYL